MSEAASLSLEGQIIKSENFSKKSLNGSSFAECTFDNCDFTESGLRNAQFYQCIFVNCNLSLMKLDGCRLQEGRFLGCKIVGAEFFKCDQTFFSVEFKNCVLQYCNFSDLNMKNARFAGSKLKECHFTSTVLTGADFAEVDLTGTVFHNCDLSRADFSQSISYQIDPQTNKIKKAKFSLPEAVGLLSAFDITII
jgi:fluoroquinolone resistance protein